jgi:2-iminobutanoate/2-iminopropanoate deaminase
MLPELKRTVASSDAPAGRGPFPQAVQVGPLVFVSGQGPLSTATNRPIEGDFAAQVRETFANLGKILEAAGLDLAHVVKVTVYLADLERVPEFNQLYEALMPRPYPARTLVQAGLRGIDVEMDVIAAHPGIAAWDAAQGQV